jgi:hypothetical protein
MIIHIPQWTELCLIVRLNLKITTVLDEQIQVAFPKERLAVARITAKMSRGNLTSENASGDLENKLTRCCQLIDVLILGSKLI